MRGLDTRGFADGAMKGFEFMERIYDKKHDRERQDSLDQERRDYRTQQQDNWETNRSDAQAHRDQTQENWQSSFDANSAQRDRTYGLQVESAKNAEKHRQHQRGRQDKLDGVAEQQRIHQQNLEYIQQSYQMAAQGVPFDDRFYEIVSSHPRYGAADPRRLVSEEAGIAIEQGKSVMDQSNPAQMNDPESLAAMNFLFDHDINSDREGNPLEGRRRLVGMYPGKEPGTVVGELEMEDGRRVPITSKRGSEQDGDNTVLQQPVKGMIQKLASADQMRKFLLSPKGQAAIVNAGRGLGHIPKAKAADWEIIKRTITDENGNKVIVPAARHNKTTGDYLPFNDPSAAAGNPQSAAEAEQYAEERIAEIESWLGSDASDFKQWGGKARAREIFKKEFMEMNSPQRATGLNIPPKHKQPKQKTTPVQSILDANPSWSQAKAEAYLAHLNKR